MLTIEALKRLLRTNRDRVKAGFIVDGANYRGAEAPTTNGAIAPLYSKSEYIMRL
ncbi:MAG: hypothetical protein RIE73_38095 [Coleofasciculus sp. C1-SOL-03]